MNVILNFAHTGKLRASAQVSSAPTRTQREDAILIFHWDDHQISVTNRAAARAMGQAMLDWAG